MSGSITVGGKTLASHDNGTGNLSLNNNVQFPAGHVIQVGYVEYTNTVEINNTSYVDIGTSSNGLIISAFTPKKDNSKLIIQFKVEIGGGGGADNGGNLAVHINDVIVNPPIPTGFNFAAHAGTDSNQSSTYGGGVGEYNTNTSVGMTYYDVTSLTPFKVSVKGLFRTDSTTDSFWVNRANNSAATLNTHYVSNLLVWELAQ